MKEIILSDGVKTLVSDEDYYFLSGFKWSASSGYAMKKEKGVSMYMHRLVASRMGLSLKKDIDHINRNKLDNRRENLRLSNHSSNGINRGIPKSNTSGFKGIQRLRHTDIWVARIMKDRKNIYIGVFDTKEEASKAYKDVAIKLFGDFEK